MVLFVYHLISIAAFFFTFDVLAMDRPEPIGQSFTESHGSSYYKSIFKLDELRELPERLPGDGSSKPTPTDCSEQLEAPENNQTVINIKNSDKQEIVRRLKGNDRMPDVAIDFINRIGKWNKTGKNKGNYSAPSKECLS